METKDLWFKMRISRKDFNKAKALAKIYAKGNLSAWAIHGMLEAPRKYLFAESKKPAKAAAK